MFSSKYPPAHLAFMIIGFACFGITVEVFFTAFTSLFEGVSLCGKPLAALAGTSYVWMAFIYGSIPLLGILLHDKIAPHAIWLRLLAYLILIYTVEFVSGYFLQCVTGKCPWQYTTGHHIMGLIQLDYAPGWLLFAWLTEQLYVFMNTRVIK